MIKLGCNAMLPVARPVPYPDNKDGPRKWENVEKVIRMIYDLRIDIVDLQPDRRFRSKEPANLHRKAQPWIGCWCDRYSAKCTCRCAVGESILGTDFCYHQFGGR